MINVKLRARKEEITDQRPNGTTRRSGSANDGEAVCNVALDEGRYTRGKVVRIDEDSLVQGIRLLSPREIEVLSWLAAGKSAVAAAMILNISVYTVRVHIRNILQKLSASNIAHAIARGFEFGILASGHSRSYVKR